MTLAKCSVGVANSRLKEVPPHHFSSLVALAVREDPRLGT